MGSFGERLRREREMRGITIEEIAEATKIGSRSLRALEDEHFSQLPGGIFNKGFVRAYAKFLGLDEEQAVADYMAAEASYRETSPSMPQVETQAPKSTETSNSAVIAIVLILVLAAGGFGGWKWYQNRQAQKQAAAQQAAAEQASREAAQAAAPPIAVVKATDASTQPADTTSAGSTPGSPNAPATDASKGAVSPAPSSDNPDGFTVELKAKKDSWVSAKADGKLIPGETVKASAGKTFHAKDRLILTLGNAGGVEISYNGKALDLGHAAGQVKTLTFTAQGLQPETPQQQ